MIPILYNADETRFINNGRGRLTDATRCVVTEERNGIFELEIDYPITGEHYEEIQLGRIIAATHDNKGDLQPFIIYSRTIPNLQGIVTFNAHHISYKLSDIVVMPFEAGSCAAALEGIKNHAVNINPFNFWTDKTTVANFKSEEPRNARNMLGGEQNSILDVFGGGEYKFDKFDVRLYAQRGQDTDCEIRYGKNLTDLTQTIDATGTYNAVVPFWRSTEGGIIMLPERLLVYSGIEPQVAYLTDHNLIIIRTETGEPIEVAYRQVQAAPMDLTDQFEDPPTAAQLRAAANARFQASHAWEPSESIAVNFVQLWQTEEFEEYSALQRVGLCDTVSVYYPQGGVRAVKQKVIKTTYNTLLDRYDSIELGAQQTSLAQAMRSEILQDVPTTSMMDQAIRYATELIRGGLGGYVVMTPGPNGYPQEILIMDTPDVNTAVNVWRFNQGGLGHSSNGYEGPYSDIALTQDGKINATMITTGALNAGIITTGILKDADNNTSFNLNTGAFSMKKGSINLGDGNFIATDAGKVTIVGGGYITDSDGLNFWNLDSGQFVTEQGRISGFTISNDRLLYQSSVRHTVFSNEEIHYYAQHVGDTRYGTQIKGGDIYFKYRGDSTSWSLANKYAIRYYGDADALSFEKGSSSVISLNQSGNSSIWFYGNSVFYNNLHVNGDFTVSGNKNRRVKTSNYSDRLLYCYETPTPLFGDIGEATLDEEGICYIDIDDILQETIAERVEYQVFLQPEGEGTCYIAEKTPRFFVIKGTPDLKVAWELKAKQKDYEALRLEPAERNLEEYTRAGEQDQTLEDYIREQEGLLYGYN